MATDNTFENFVSLLRNSTARPRVGLAPATDSDIVAGLLAGQPSTMTSGADARKPQRGQPANSSTPAPVTSVDWQAGQDDTNRSAARQKQLETAGSITSPGYRAHLDSLRRNENAPGSRTSNADWEAMFPKRATDNYLQPGQAPDPEARMRTFAQMRERGVAPTVGRVEPNVSSDRPDSLMITPSQPLFNPDLSAQQGGAVYSTPYGTIGRADGQPIPDTSGQPSVPGNYYSLTPPGGSSTTSAPTVAPGGPASATVAAPVAGVSGSPVSGANSTRPGPVNDPYNMQQAPTSPEFGGGMTFDEFLRPGAADPAQAGAAAQTAGSTVGGAIRGLPGRTDNIASPVTNPGIMSAIARMLAPTVAQQVAPELSSILGTQPQPQRPNNYVTR